MALIRMGGTIIITMLLKREENQRYLPRIEEDKSFIKRLELSSPHTTTCSLLGNFGLKLQNSPKLPHIHARLYCNANEKK